jgi:hypothetical protein
LQEFRLSGERVSDKFAGTAVFMAVTGENVLKTGKSYLNRVKYRCVQQGYTADGQVESG